ncbi:Na+/H+ antiporter NhaA [Amnibacterium endophyticum]|uniref:Na(+)/H(+) antiporter NhaA n=1 Tax=Amnibacterium endophyticum TaxID=2109337 RepID=A0ABW4LAY5_9MICO
MRFITSDRGSATLLLAAAALALILAATPLGPGLLAARDLHLPVDFTGLHLTVEHLISDGLLAIFFLLIAIELRHELTHGDLANPRAAIVPAAAAFGGVALPAAVYLAFTGGGEASGGWPIPTATDIAFALGLLALLGRGLPSRVRAFLLGLAILDDLIAILLIAVVFPKNLQPLLLLPAAALLGVFLLVARLTPRRPGVRLTALVVLGVLVWYFTALSGVHATLAGVALGLVLPAGLAGRTDRALQPVSRGLILPIFAFSASLIRLEDVSGETFGPAFWGVAVGLPVGKLVGIMVATTIAVALVGRTSPSRLTPQEIVAVGLVAGVGFTVSLLMAQLAFGEGMLGTSTTLGVLIGSAISIVLSAVFVPLIARRSRQAQEALVPQP